MCNKTTAGGLSDSALSKLRIYCYCRRSITFPHQAHSEQQQQRQSVRDLPDCKESFSYRLRYAKFERGTSARRPPAYGNVPLEQPLPREKSANRTTCDGQRNGRVRLYYCPHAGVRSPHHATAKAARAVGVGPTAGPDSPAIFHPRDLSVTVAVRWTTAVAATTSPRTDLLDTSRRRSSGWTCRTATETALRRRPVSVAPVGDVMCGIREARRGSGVRAAAT